MTLLKETERTSTKKQKKGGLHLSELRNTELVLLKVLTMREELAIILQNTKPNVLLVWKKTTENSSPEDILLEL